MDRLYVRTTDQCYLRCIGGTLGLRSTVYSLTRCFVHITRFVTVKSPFMDNSIWPISHQVHWLNTKTKFLDVFSTNVSTRHNYVFLLCRHCVHVTLLHLTFCKKVVTKSISLHIMSSYIYMYLRTTGPSTLQIRNYLVSMVYMEFRFEWIWYILQVG